MRRLKADTYIHRSGTPALRIAISLVSIDMSSSVISFPCIYEHHTDDRFDRLIWFARASLIASQGDKRAEALAGKQLHRLRVLVASAARTAEVFGPHRCGRA